MACFYFSYIDLISFIVSPNSNNDNLFWQQFPNMIWFETIKNLS